MTRGAVDSQRSKLYAAENKAAWSDKARDRLDERAAQQMVDKMTVWLRSNGFRLSTINEPRVVLTRQSAEGSVAYYRSGEIRFGGGRNLRWILIHEMAHLVRTNLDEFSEHPDPRAHGAPFAHIYLRLVRRFLGVADHDALKAAFKAGGVRFRPKRTRVISDTERAAIAARLAAHRRPPSPHRYTWTRTVTDALTGDDIVIYASRFRRDYVRWREPHSDGTWPAQTSGTTTPANAATRTTIDGINKLRDTNWWSGIDEEWSVVDIADLVAPIEAEAAAAKAAVIAVATGKARRRELWTLITGSARTASLEALEAAAAILTGDTP